MLRALFFVQAHAIALWYVPLSNVLRAHGLEQIVPYAFACSGVAAFISPMLAGTLADHRYSAERILRWIALGAGSCLFLTYTAIERGWGAGWVLVFLQMQALCAAPAWSLATTIVLAQQDDPERQFGPVRVWATFGWMFAGPLLSFVLQADASTKSGFVASGVWFSVAAITLLLPNVPPPAGAGLRHWRDVLGVPALQLLRHRDHRAVFFTAALFSIPFAAFYPFTPIHLHHSGEQNAAAVMSLGQVTEVIAMYALAPLLTRFSLKTIFLTGIGFGVLRYALFALDVMPALLAGVALHGACYTLFFIPAQIYLEKRVDPQFRARAQALLTVMMAGAGNLFGSLGCGWWRSICETPTGTNWQLYWGVLCVLVAVVFVYFAMAYRGTGPPRAPLDRRGHTTEPELAGVGES